MKLALIAAALAPCVATAGMSGMVKAEGGASVANQFGTVAVQAHTPEMLVSGDLVVTTSEWAVVKLDSGARIEVAPNSQVRLAENLELLEGAIRYTADELVIETADKKVLAGKAVSGQHKVAGGASQGAVALSAEHSALAVQNIAGSMQVAALGERMAIETGEAQAFTHVAQVGCTNDPAKAGKGTPLCREGQQSQQGSQSSQGSGSGQQQGASGAGQTGGQSSSGAAASGAQSSGGVAGTTATTTATTTAVGAAGAGLSAAAIGALVGATIIAGVFIKEEVIDDDDEPGSPGG